MFEIKNLLLILKKYNKNIKWLKIQKMLFKFREKPKYLNDEVDNEVKEKWFSVYNYIDLKELLLTSRKDFLEILSKINVGFGIISIFLGIFSYYSGLIFILPVFLFLAYFIIFLVLFFKLLGRTKLFLYVADVVYTKTWMMISDDFLYYKKDAEKIDKKLEKYSNIFSEYLGKSSRLEEIIAKKKKEVFDWTMDKSWGFMEMISKLGRNKNSAGLALVLVLSMFLYVVSLYLFYYIWYFFIFIFSKIYLFFLKIVLSFKDNIELKIKDKTLEIDEKLENMQNIYKVLKNKIEEFKSWEISNIWDFVEDKFSDFYVQIDLILQEKKKLQEVIEKSKYKDIIDFDIFKKYLKKNFNAPIKDMISLLEVYEKLLKNQIDEINKWSPHLASPIERGIKQNLDINNTEILEKNLEFKKVVLEDKLIMLERSKKSLDESIL